MKDATPIYADVAVPSALGLFSQRRQRMLKAVSRFDSAAAEAFEFDCEKIKERIASEDGAVRLAARVDLVKSEEAAQGNDIDQLSIDGIGSMAKCFTN